MNKLIAYFIKYPIWANALIVVTAIAGVLSLFIMPKSFFPEMNPNRVYVNVAYPGASPKEIEEGITTKVEESLNGIQGVKEITSTSSENISNITVTGIEGIDLDKMLQDVKNAVDGISQFPAGAEKPLVFAQTSRGMGGLSNVVGFYSLYGPLIHLLNLLSLKPTLQENQPFVLEYMDWLGHHEFGLHQKQFKFSNSLIDSDKNELNFWINSWVNYYEYVATSLSDEIILICYEDYCKTPQIIMNTVLSHLQKEKVSLDREPFNNKTVVSKDFDQALVDRANKLYNSLKAKVSYSN